MSLLETILSARSGELVKGMAKSNGIDINSALSVLGKLIPSLSQSLNQNSQSSGGIEALMKAMQKGDHQRYVQRSDEAFSSAAREDGNSILGHILGGKEASRNLAGQVASETGLGADLIKKMLPQAAALLMGALGQQGQSGGALSQLTSMLGGGQKSQASSLLGSFLDRDKDGSIIDDLMAMAAKQLLR
jgi:hypothetical protein